MTTQVTQEKLINGFDTEKMLESVEALKQNPELAQFQFRACNHWKDGSQNQIKIGGYYGTGQELGEDRCFEYQADEPTVLLGQDQSANPAEYLLTALSSCMTTSLSLHAAAEGIKVEAIESDYEGDMDIQGFLNLDPNVRRGYKEIRVRFKVNSDANATVLKELAERSPILDTIRNPTPVRVEFVTE